MKITAVESRQTGSPYVGGAYRWGAGEAIAVATATVVVLRTDAGLLGCGAPVWLLLGGKLTDGSRCALRGVRRREGPA